MQQGIPMLLPPILGVVNFYFIKILLVFVVYRNSKIHPAILAFYFIAVLPTVLVKLYVIHHHKDFRLGDLMKIP
jgi:hypothetical protein